MRNKTNTRGVVSRRRALQLTGFPALGLALPALSRAQPASEQAPQGVALEPLNRFPRIVHEYFVRRVRRSERSVVAC